MNVKTSVPCFEPVEPVGQTSSPVLAVSLIVIGGSSVMTTSAGAETAHWWSPSPKSAETVKG